MADELRFIDRYQEALSSGDTELAERLKKAILTGRMDDTEDKEFLESIQGKQLVSNMKKFYYHPEEVSHTALIKMVSSLITHNVIESELRGKSLDEYPVKELYVLLGELLNREEGENKNVRKFISDRYGKFL